uniref:Ig-like domain-containing protein n=1 Tax=Astyanax mexicanus TaxID=7994 RepID=A0A3B1K7S2_ASTMX
MQQLFLKRINIPLGFTLFFILILVRLKLVGAAAPLVAEAGEDLVLPCSLQPSISGLMVEWIRTDLNKVDTIVHLYEDLRDRNYDQLESYRGRTALFYEELQKGNTSLKLSAIQTSDEGAYQCHVASITWHDEAMVYIIILFHFVAENFVVVGPVGPLVAEADQDELILPCSLHPNISAEGMMVEWIRTDLNEVDTIVHLYEDRKDRNYDQLESYRGRTALFFEELQKGNTSLKLSAIQPSDEGAYQCHVASITCHNKAIVYVELLHNSLTLVQIWRLFGHSITVRILSDSLFLKYWRHNLEMCLGSL